MKSSSYLEPVDNIKIDKKTQAKIVKQLPGLPVLFNSDINDIIGKVVSAKIEDNRIVYTVEYNEKGIKYLEGLQSGLSHKVGHIGLRYEDESPVISVVDGE